MAQIHTVAVQANVVQKCLRHLYLLSFLAFFMLKDLFLFERIRSFNYFLF